MKQSFFRTAARLRYRLSRHEARVATVLPTLHGGMCSGLDGPKDGHGNAGGSASRPYWARSGLDVRQGRLAIAGRDAIDIAEEHGTPLFVIDLERIAEQARALQGALRSAGLKPRGRLALKAQREPEVPRFLRSPGTPGSATAIGIDSCSPGEVELALAHGWRPDEISCTGTNLSDEDFARLLPHKIHINTDLLSQLERLGRHAPGRTVGLRVNPRAGVAWAGGATLYGGKKPSKFGVYEEQLSEALTIARRHQLSLDTVHMHVADGFLNDGLEEVEAAVVGAARMAAMLLEAGCPITEVNTGGGLGVPLRQEDEPLDLEAWAEVLRTHLSPLGVEVGTEPGNFLAKESTILLARIVSVEDRLGTRFVGPDVGWNVMSYRFLCRKPFDIVVCRDPVGRSSGEATVAGNINEGDDRFAEEYPFPEVEEGDVVAILGVGGYNQAMQSDHCLRPRAATLCFRDRV